MGMGHLMIGIGTSCCLTLDNPLRYIGPLHGADITGVTDPANKHIRDMGLTPPGRTQTPSPFVPGRQWEPSGLPPYSPE